MFYFKPILTTGCLLVAFASQSLASIQVDDFTGAYDVLNWTTVTQGNSSVDTSGAPATIQLIGSDTGSGFEASVTFSIAAQAGGLFEFDWAYQSNDQDGPEWDPGFFLNDTFFQLTDDSGSSIQSGSVSVPVIAGDDIGWKVTATDNLFGNATLAISNFSAPAIPEPTSLIVWGLLGSAVGLKRRRR